jgi:hypothetical protein
MGKRDPVCTQRDPVPEAAGNSAPPRVTRPIFPLIRREDQNGTVLIGDPHVLIGSLRPREISDLIREGLLFGSRKSRHAL